MGESPHPSHSEIIPVHTTMDGHSSAEADTEILLTHHEVAVSLRLGDTVPAPVVWIERDLIAGWRIIIAGDGDLSSAGAHIEVDEAGVLTIHDHEPTPADTPITPDEDG